MKTTRLLAVAIMQVVLAASVIAPAAEIRQATYNRWPALSMSNGIVELHVTPQLGGRVIQLRLGSHEYLWFNKSLAGQNPPPGGVGPKGAWINWGGDKLWTAPQGWDGDHQWPGPPNAILDGSPHDAKILSSTGPTVALQLTSRDDPQTGVRMSRVIRLIDGTARVSFDSTMTNSDTRFRRWGIWQVTQISAEDRSGKAAYNKDIRCYAPINPASRFERGYTELYGLVNNPSFRADQRTGLLTAHYQRLVGKVGLDSSAGWCAIVDGAAGYVFVERFAFYPGKAYPDNSSVEFWMSGVGQIVCGKEIVDLKDDPEETPCLVESEVLAPFAELQPGQSASFRLEWCAARIGGNFPVLHCTAYGVVCQPLLASSVHGKFRLTGQFAFFQPSAAQIVYRDAAGKTCGSERLGLPLGPDSPLALNHEPSAPAGATTASLLILDATGNPLGELASVTLPR